MEDVKSQVTAAQDAKATIDATIANQQDELAKANTLRTNINANVRYRNEEKEIKKVQVELDGFDIEQAARSRREFNTKYRAKMDEENNKAAIVSPLIFWRWKLM
jgi:DNA repair protein RAD50